MTFEEMLNSIEIDTVPDDDLDDDLKDFFSDILEEV